MLTNLIFTPNRLKNHKLFLAITAALFAASAALTHPNVSAVELRAPQLPQAQPPQPNSTPALQPSRMPASTPVLVPNTEAALGKKDQGLLFASPSINVKQIEVKASEFPIATAEQYKVGFECTISALPSQKDYSKYPRHTCFIDQPRTTTLNSLNIARVDSWPSADGITTKIIMIADKKSAKNPNPYRIRTAFQLLHETSPTVSKPVLKDFAYADGLLKK